MDHFNYIDDRLHGESTPLAKIADAVGTPTYVYSRATIERHWHAFDQAFGDHPHLILYAVKANSNLAVLGLMAQLGSGFDIVSIGELDRVIAAGGDPGKTVFSGVGKSAAEIERAISLGIRSINIESVPELDRVESIASRLKIRTSVGIRVNPDVDAKTHPYIATGLEQNKFGVAMVDAPAIYSRVNQSEHLDVHSIACHIGSQLTDLAPYIETVDRIVDLYEKLKADGIDIPTLDLGGGLGVRYRDEQPPQPAQYAAAIIDRLQARGLNIPVSIEPGRAIVANAGVLLTRVEYLKTGAAKNFAIVDAAMNDLLRPSLYQAYQEIIPENRVSTEPERTYDVVGPICESGDWIGQDRQLQISADDLLVVRTVGAYGYVMSSNYNTRPRAAEVMIDGDRYQVVRDRENTASLFENEYLLKKQSS